MTPGSRFGRYQILRALGRGAMGEVYLAVDTELRRQVALKLVYRGSDRDDLEILDAERLGAELQKRVAAIDKRVVAVNRYGEINGDLFIEMEYIEGEDLSVRVGRGSLSSAMAARIGRELAEMLENIGAFTTTIADKQFSGVIHGDLKPRNVRLTTREEVKVLDFGIAKALSHTRKQTMSVFASTAYCSPERLETQNMDQASDLWSVGVLLYQMTSGRLPFDEPNKERLERRIRSAQPPDPLPDSCPEPLRRIVFKMLAHDPEARYTSATELKHELMRYERGEPILAEVPLAQPFDSDATVRTTVRDSPASDGTVRTSAPVLPVVQSVRRRSHNALGCLAAFGVVCAIAFAFGAMQWNFWNKADGLKTDLQLDREADLNDAWTRYETLNKRTHLPALLWGARRTLKKKLIEAADAPILEYRNNDAPSVYENQWIDARNELAHALELDPDDSTIKGQLRLTEGHLDRIRAAHLHGPAKQKLLSAAASKFEEAADLLKKSPDPYLGLARLYVYDLGDVDRAEQALNKAAEYGHPEGKRERAQLADGYRRRAERTWLQSRSFITIPTQERDYLDKARQDYVRAQDLYQQVGLFGDAPRNEVAAMQGQQRVEQRLSQINIGGLQSQ